MLAYSRAGSMLTSLGSAAALSALHQRGSALADRPSYLWTQHAGYIHISHAAGAGWWVELLPCYCLPRASYLRRRMPEAV